MRNLEVSIIEICSREEQGTRENFYLQQFLPLLNSSFTSSSTEHQIFETLNYTLKNLGGNSSENLATIPSGVSHKGTRKGVLV